MLRQMKYFVTIVEKVSFTKAAEDMFISQSAISQQMQILEKKLDTQLFIRKKRSFILTPAGEYFYTQAKIILSECDEICKKVRNIGKEEIQEAKLRVGYLSNYSGQELFHAVAEFSATYPDILIDIASGIDCNKD